MIGKHEARNHYFDFLRGIAILMVVGIHTYPGGHQLNGTISDVIQLILKNAFNCAVPLFLAISGYFISQKKLTTFSECLSFLRKQIPTVYIPCLVFSLPWLVINCISVNFEWQEVSKSLVYYFLCGYSVYYFIALIIECYLLTPFLVRFNNKKTLIVVILISVISICILEYIRFINGVELPLIVRGAFPPLLIFYYLGIYLAKHSRAYPLYIPLSMIIVGLIIGLLHMQFLRSNYGIAGDGQKISLYLFDIGVILLCLSKKIETSYKGNFLNRIILYVGEISFGIYFTHVYIIYIADRFIPWMRESWILLWIFSIVLTIIIIIILKKFAPVSSRKYFGYR